MEQEEICTKLIELSKDVGVWSPTDYVALVHHKAFKHPIATDFKEQGGLVDVQPPDLPVEPTFDSWQLERVILTSVAMAVFDLNDNFKLRFDSTATDKARARVMRQLASRSFQAYLDSFLKKADLPFLHDLSWKYAGKLAGALKEKITKRPFIIQVIKEDIAQGNHVRSLSLLFMMSALDPKYDQRWEEVWSGWEFKVPSVDTLITWSQELFKDSDDAAHHKEVIVFIGGLGGHLAGSPGKPETASFVSITQSFYAAALNEEHDQGYINKVKKVLGVLTDADFKDWKMMTTQFSDVWRQTKDNIWAGAVKQEIQVRHGGRGYFNGWINARHTEETQTDTSPASFPADEHITKEASLFMTGAYLPGGTNLAIGDGDSMVVEKLQQGDKVLVGARPARDAVVSSVPRRIYIETSLVGFNGEQPWAGVAQVFHTTTGLRAVDPEAAMQQNPWLTIRPLAEGHMIYKLGNKGEYVPVEIRTITKTPATLIEAYDMRLSGDERSHHANGYLVHLNYPDLTVSDVARSLSAIPSEQQLEALASIPELRPLLQNWDMQTVIARLRSEISDFTSSPVDSPRASTLASKLSLSPGIRANSSAFPSLSRLNRSYQLRPLDGSKVAQHKMPCATLIDGMLLLDGEPQTQCAVNDHTRVVNWSRQVGDELALFGHGHLKIHNSGRGATGLVFISQAANPTDTQEGEIIHVYANGRGPSETKQVAGDSIFDNTWDITVDQDPWPRDATRETPAKPLSLGELVETTVDGTAGTNVYTIHIPHLDDLLKVINATLKPSERIDDLYESHQEIVEIPSKTGSAPKKIFRSVATLKHAPLLSMMSDQGIDTASSWKRTFTKALGSKSPGAAYAFDPTMREGKGERFLLTGKNQDDYLSLRTRISKKFLGATPGLPFDQDPTYSPSQVVHLLQGNAKTTVQDLIELDYNASEVHKVSQDYIFNAMVYHMDDKQRDTFTKRSKESLEKTMPVELKSQLPTEVKKFLHDTYAPAFIAQMIGANSEYRKYLSNEDWEKVWYWWAGNGDKCLAKSKWYVVLNKIASQCATREHFNLNMEQSEATALAQDLLTEVKRKNRIKQFVNGGHMATDVNKVCSLFNALDPEKDLAKSWFDQILKLLQDDTAHQVRGKQARDELAKDHLYDTMKTFIELLLAQDSQLTGEVAAKLVEDLRDFEKQNGTNISDTAKKQAENIMVKMAELPQQLAGLLQTAAPIAKKLSGTRLFEFAGSVVDSVAKNIPDGLKRIAKYIGKLSVVGYLFMQSLSLIGANLSWNNMSDSQRAETVLQTMKVVVDAATQAFEKWEAWREASGTEAEQAKASMVLDESLSKVSLSEDNLAVTIADRDPVLKEEGGVKFTVSERIKQVEVISIEEISPTELETWSEKLTEEPKFTPPGPVAEETVTQLSLTTKALRGLSIALGAGVAAAMTFSLIHDWKDLTTAGKVINTLSVVVQILAVLVEGVSLLVDVGLIASSVFAAALPIVGAVLALAGVVLMILSVCGIQLYKEPPTPNPVKDFVDQTVRTLINDWPSPPKAQLLYETDKPSLASGDTSLTVSATNNTAAEIDLMYAQITVYGGGTSDCLFTEDSFNNINPEGKDNGTLTVTPGKEKYDISLLPHRVGENPAAFVFNLSLKGLRAKDNPEGYLKLKASEKISSVWKGHASRNGGSSIIEIVEVMTNMDKTHSLLTVLKSS